MAMSKTVPWSPALVFFTALLLGILLGAVGMGLVGGQDGGPENDKQPSVSCTAFTVNGTANGMCFVSGDVDFRWINGSENTTNGTVTLSDLPEENSTVRRGR